jgi:hypothetical protein
MRRLSGQLTYANVMSTVAVFLVVTGGAAFAASQLGKNSVGTKQLKKNSVTTAKIKKNAVTGAKVKKHTLTGSNINLNKLGTVPNATHANSADSIPPAEPTHIVGASGEPAFAGGSVNYPGKIQGLSLPPVGFYKDPVGIVHLEGAVKLGSTPVIFTLPPGYRPASGTLVDLETTKESPVIILGSAGEGAFGAGDVLGDSPIVLLEGVAFRARS